MFYIFELNFEFANFYSKRALQILQVVTRMHLFCLTIKQTQHEPARNSQTSLWGKSLFENLILYNYFSCTCIKMVEVTVQVQPIFVSEFS